MLSLLLTILIGCQEGAPPPVAGADGAHKTDGHHEDGQKKDDHGADHTASNPKSPSPNPAAHSGEGSGTVGPPLTTIPDGPPMTIDARLIQPPRKHDPAPARFQVEWETTKGTFTMDCHRDWSPNGADRLYFLVTQGYFRDIAFYRVVPGFMAQFGYHGKPPLNKVWRTAKIQDDPVVQSNTRGMVSFATSGANTRTTQLFINYGNNARLDKMQFSPVCQVSEADMKSVVDTIDASHGERPNQGLLAQLGNGYLRQQFPKLDYIVEARLKK